ncbi:MAG: transporter substrate-binding domain-containing protein [Alteromonadaceae bacterium]|nr:transporter substrate-binding domain-containing protein [Alteromonadaceae bacterium]
MIKLNELILLSLLLTCLSSNSFAKKKVFIVSYGANDAPPYAMTQGGKLSTGIIKDIFDRIAKELKIPIEYVKTPRKRAELYLSNERVNAIAISNPQWLANSHLYQWSEPIFAEKDWLVTLTKECKNINLVSDMQAMIIGTTRGYVYPKLTHYFNNKSILRSDAKNIQANFQRLKLGRLDGFIDSNILIEYHLQLYYPNKKQQAQFTIEKVKISQHYIHTAISANSPVSAIEFNQVLAQLKTTGTISAILKKYSVQQNMPHKTTSFKQ